MLNIITFHFMYLVLVLMLIVPSGYAISAIGKVNNFGFLADLFVGLLSVLNICFGILLVLGYIFGGSLNA